MPTHKPFPLRGVIGVVANSPDEIEQAVARGLQCVEIRADLLLDTGTAIGELPAVIQRTRAAGLAALFTLRHPEHGGKFNGSEDERVAINRQALNAGADIIDVEWDQSAASTMLAEGAPLVLSYHDFSSMPDDSQLAALTEKMCEAAPWAIKIVPTASTLADPVRMLKWSEMQSQVVRIGFAMGETGGCSRILTTAFSAPVTYASFGEPVAPGQVAIDALLDNYRVPDLNGDTQVVAVLGSSAGSMEAVARLNREYRDEGTNTVAINFPGESVEEINPYREALRIIEIHASA